MRFREGQTGRLVLDDARETSEEGRALGVLFHQDVTPHLGQHLEREPDRLRVPTLHEHREHQGEELFVLEQDVFITLQEGEVTQHLEHGTQVLS